MALDHLLAVLQTEAETEAEEILASARQRAEELRARVAAELAQRRARDQQLLEAQQASELALLLVSAHRTARRMELESRERMLARVLDQAQRRLGTLLERPDCHQSIAGQVRQSLDCLALRSATIRVHPRLVETVTGAVEGRSGVTVIADGATGTGFRLTSDDGTLVIDGTLEDRMARMKRHLDQVILAHWEEAV